MTERRTYKRVHRNIKYKYCKRVIDYNRYVKIFSKRFYRNSFAGQFEANKHDKNIDWNRNNNLGDNGATLNSPLGPKIVEVKSESSKVDKEAPEINLLEEMMKKM